MSKSQRLELILNQAKEMEKRYDWAKAEDLYEQALRVDGKVDFLKTCEIRERIAYCSYRAAFGAETQEEFRKRIELSEEAYGEAAELFDKSEDSEKHARTDFCKAMASYSRSWLAEDSAERKAFLDECLKLGKEALKVYEETGDKLGYGKVCNELLTCLFDRLWLTWDWQERKNILSEAIEHGERAIEALSEARDDYELARTYYMMGFIYHFRGWGVDESPEKQKVTTHKSLTYAQKALDFSEKTSDSYLIGMSSYIIWWLFHAEGDLKSQQKYSKKQLELGLKIKDNLMIARASEGLAVVSWIKTKMEDDPNKKGKGFSKAIQLAEDAMTHYQLVSYPFTYLYGIHTDCYSELAFCKTSLEEKRALLGKATEVGRKALEQAKRSGSYTLFQPFRSLSKAFYFLSTMETKTTEKRKLLQKASEYREAAIDLLKQIIPFFYWTQSVECSYSALIKAELAEIETDNQEKTDLLVKAVADMEDCLKSCKKTIETMPQTRYLSFTGQYQYWFGGILNQLYLLTGQKGHLERATEVYEDAVQTWEKADQPSQVAEAHWQKAKLYSHLGEHSKSAHEFESASERYRRAAGKIQKLTAFYLDYATYMQAWSEIEKARHHHAEKRHGQAKEHYTKAADLHRSTERWNYLRLNYLAWARLEEAEDLSRREQAEEARGRFQQAAELFAEARKSGKAKLETLEASDEKKLTAELVKASDIRREYCLGRVALEEAKTLDRQGNHAASSRNYGSATARFQKAVDTMKLESGRQELRPIVALCRAWQMMTQAEAEASPELYLEASQLFDEAKKHSLDEKAKILALGHSRFCKALEAGARFEDSRSMSLYSTAKKHVEAATNYYIKAGFKTATEYAKATYRLFDAYMFMYKAQTETDPEKKAQFYQMAEKLLQASVGSYMKAKYPEKSREVKRLLESVREERQLATSLAEVLHAPTIASTTASFSTPTPSYETAAGLERFEHAHVQANLFIQLSEVRVGEKVAMEIDLVNAGKGPATLVKVENIAPVGFNVIEKPKMYRVEDSYLNLKGKRLDSLKSEEVKVVVKPQSKGTFVVRPRIFYIDETGKYRSHEPEPVTITVKELGIRGWIKGER